MQEVMREALRVLVVDDSAVMRGILKTLFAMHAENTRSELPRMEICGEARDGVECLEMVSRLKPDVLLLDLEMPRMHGLDVLDKLRAESPEVPVIMCSAYTEYGARSTVDALARGAEDYVMKPSHQSDFLTALRVLSEQVLPKIAALAEGRCRRRAAGRLSRTEQSSNAGIWSRSELNDSAMRREVAAQPRIELIVVGASTGGPSALELVLSSLPADLPVPILIVQHMPKLFTGALAKRLDRCCALPVREAYEGAMVMAGTVWLAPGDVHMEVKAAVSMTRKDQIREQGIRISLHAEQPLNFCRPSVDYLFNSAARLCGTGTLAVIMTGMGVDGVAGARYVHGAGGTVLAQDEATSVVWGMPGRVTEAGIASGILPLQLLGPDVVRRVWVGRERKCLPRVEARQSASTVALMGAEPPEVADGLY